MNKYDYEKKSNESMPATYLRRKYNCAHSCSSKHLCSMHGTYSYSSQLLSDLCLTN